MFRLLWLTFFGASRMDAGDRASRPRVAGVDDRRARRAGRALGDRRLSSRCRTISSRCCRCPRVQPALEHFETPVVFVSVALALAGLAGAAYFFGGDGERADGCAAPVRGLASAALRQVLRRRGLRRAASRGRCTGSPTASSWAWAIASCSTARCTGSPRWRGAPPARSAGSRRATCSSTRCSCSRASSRRSRGAGAMADAALLNLVLYLPLIGVGAARRRSASRRGSRCGGCRSA